MMLTRATHAARVNEIINDPSIYPWVKGSQAGPLDMSTIVADTNNVFLVGEHGCVIFFKIQPGVYDFHTSVLPEGRGEWMRQGASEAFHYMFTQTDAYELLTKCPDGNVASKIGAKSVGCSLQFRTGPIWETNGTRVCVDVYSLLIQNWVIKAPGLEEKGHWFHETLISEYKRLGKNIEVVADDLVHDRYVGAAVEMIRGKQLLKAVNFYNRWAIMAGYKLLFVVNKDPLILDINEARVCVGNNSFEVL